MKFDEEVNFKVLKNELVILENQIANGEIGKYKVPEGLEDSYKEIGMNWADVAVTPSEPKVIQGQSFYPDLRYVVTPKFDQVNWLFSNIGNIFWKIDGYGMWKEELFGRLGNMANRYISRNLNYEAKDLLGAILHEAFSCLEDLEDGDFNFLVVAVGNKIYDDYLERLDQNDFLSPKETLDYFTSKGVGVDE